MAEQGSIIWQRIPEGPDGQMPFTDREVLLCVPNILGTADGGDGVRLHPSAPYLYYLGIWEGTHWLTDLTDRDGDFVYLELREPKWWAEITPPGARP